MGIFYKNCVCTNWVGLDFIDFGMSRPGCDARKDKQTELGQDRFFLCVCVLLYKARHTSCSNCAWKSIRTDRVRLRQKLKKNGPGPCRAYVTGWAGTIRFSNKLNGCLDQTDLYFSLSGPYKLIFLISFKIHVFLYSGVLVNRKRHHAVNRDKRKTFFSFVSFLLKLHTFAVLYVFHNCSMLEYINKSEGDYLYIKCLLKKILLVII